MPWSTLMSRRLKSEVVAAKIKELASQGYKTSQIAKGTGLSYHAVRQRAKTANITIEKRQHKGRDYIESQLSRLYLSLKSGGKLKHFALSEGDPEKTIVSRIKLTHGVYSIKEFMRIRDGSYKN